MKGWNIISIIVICMLVVVGGFSIYKWYSFGALAQDRLKELNSKDTTIDGLNKDILIKQQTIEDKENEINILSTLKQQQALDYENRLIEKDDSIRVLNNKINSKDYELSSARDTITQQSNTIGQLTEETQDTINQIYQLQNWVGENAAIGNTMFSELFGPTTVVPVEYFDITDGGQGCLIYPERISEAMDQNGIMWVSDTSTSYGRSSDSLSKVYNFWNAKKGDCDDFSLFYASAFRELNKQLSFCDAIYTNINNEWRVEIKPYVVCGKLNSGGGHCEVILTSTNIKVGSNVGSMDMVEPQSGSYDGTVYGDFEYVWEIISDTDVFMVKDFVVTESLSNMESKLQSLYWEVGGMND